MNDKKLKQYLPYLKECGIKPEGFSNGALISMSKAMEAYHRSKTVKPVVLSDLPEDMEQYTCSDCGRINVKLNNNEIRVGFCDGCEHPLWNPSDNPKQQVKEEVNEIGCEHGILIEGHHID